MDPATCDLERGVAPAAWRMHHQTKRPLDDGDAILTDGLKAAKTVCAVAAVCCCVYSHR